MNTPEATPPLWRRALPDTAFGWRFVAFAGIFAAEVVAYVLTPHPWGDYPHVALVGISFLVALFAFSKQRLGEWRTFSHPVKPVWLLIHLAAVVLLVASTVFLLGYNAGSPTVVHLSVMLWNAVTSHTRLVFPQLVRLGTALWFTAFAVVPLSLVAMVFSLPGIVAWFGGIRRPWFYAGLTAVGAMVFRHMVQVSWENPTSRIGVMMQSTTFRAARALLGLFYGGVTSDLVNYTLGTPKFQIQIAGACSGVEGLGLMLMLSVGWLVYARRELRLNRAVWLVPLMLALVWSLNVVRIDALIAIGDAGHGAIAVNGFHSQAGWILFNIAALTFLLLANNLQWLHQGAGAGDAAAALTEVSPEEERNAAAIYLLPFLAILATTFLTQAASSGFEFLYPFRLVAAVLVLWAYRREYLRMDWRFTWLGPVAGVAIFVMWLGIARYKLAADAGAVIATGLAHIPPAQRTVWLIARVCAAVITVPIAEELAFRGYLARRLAAADVESIGYQQLGWVPIVVSSVVFGIMHGNLWVAGTIAGLVFALVAKWRGRLGEAVTAHAVANLLIAIWVLVSGNYAMW